MEVGGGLFLTGSQCSTVSAPSQRTCAKTQTLPHVHVDGRAPDNNQERERAACVKERVTQICINMYYGLFITHVTVVQQVGLYGHSRHTQSSAPLCGYLLLISYSGAVSCACQLSVCQRAGQEGSFAFVDTQGQDVDGSVCSQAWSEVRVCHCQHLLPTRGRPRGTDQAAAAFLSLIHTYLNTHWASTKEVGRNMYSPSSSGVLFSSVGL